MPKTSSLPFQSVAVAYMRTPGNLHKTSKNSAQLSWAHGHTMGHPLQIPVASGRVASQFLRGCFPGPLGCLPDLALRPAAGRFLGLPLQPAVPVGCLPLREKHVKPLALFALSSAKASSFFCLFVFAMSVRKVSSAGQAKAQSLNASKICLSQK